MHFTFSKARFVDLIYVKYNFFFLSMQLFCTVVVVADVCSFVATAHAGQDLEHFHRPPKGSLVPLCSQSPHPWPCTLATTDLFCIPKFLPFLECLTNGILKHIAFGVWLISLSTVHLRDIRVVSISGSFLFVVEHSVIWLYHSLFYCSLVQGQWACFQFGAFLKKATVHIHVCVFM